MVVQIDRVSENLRVGITFRRLKDFSLSNLSSSVEAIQLEKNAPLVGEKKRVILQFEPIKEKDEYHISSIIDVPFKVRELSVEDEKLKINERIEYIPKNIEAIIRLKSQTIIFISQTQKSVTRFSKYIKDVTLKGFNPLPMQFNPVDMKKMVEYFIDINHLKVFQGNNGKIKSIGISGENLFEDDLVSEILSNDAFDISEIGGTIHVFNGDYVKFYINHRGRAWIQGDSYTPTLDHIYNLIQKIERIALKRDS